MTTSLTTRPGGSPAAPSPNPAPAPIPAARPSVMWTWLSIPFSGLALSPIVTPIVSFVQARRAKAYGQRTLKYWIPTILIELLLVIGIAVSQLGGSSPAPAAAAATQPSAAVVSAAPVAKPSGVPTTRSTVSPLGFVFATGSTPFDENGCFYTVPALALQDTLTAAEAGQLATAELQTLNEALDYRRPSCASELGRDRASLNYAAFGPATVSVSNVVVSDNHGGGWNITLTYTMSDGSKRPFVDGDIDSFQINLLLMQSPDMGDRWLI